jgi:hypothetical protein
MNERVKQLAEDTGIIITTKGMEHIVDGCYIVSPNKLEKFALLIVKECANWIKTTDPNSDIGIEDAQALLEHFGVKE